MITKFFYWLRCVLFDIHVWHWLPDPNWGLKFKECKYCKEPAGCRSWDSNYLLPAYLRDQSKKGE